MTYIDYFQPIKTFGYILVLIGTLGLFLHLLLTYDVRYTFDFKVFLIFLSFIHIFIGAGVVVKKKWGFNFFKYYLVLLYIIFPIGTYIAYKSFKYINKYNIGGYFQK